jgi:hypothetical protein
MDSYLKYKTKYLDLKKKSIISLKQKGGYGYRFNRNRRCHLVFTDDVIFFVLAKLPSTLTTMCYRSNGYIVFIGSTVAKDLLTVKDFIENYHSSIEINLAFTKFYRWISDQIAGFFELFFPHICKGSTIKSGGIGLDRCMFFKIFHSEYRLDCNVNQPWNVASSLCGKPLAVQPPGGGAKWECEIVKLSGLQSVQIVRFTATVTKDQMWMFDKYDTIKPRNNLCHFPAFIGTDCPGPMISCNQTGQLVQTQRDSNCYGVSESIKFRFVSLCNEKYSQFPLDTVFGFFRGQQLTWMHFKLKTDANFNYYSGTFSTRTPLNYYQAYVEPLIYIQHAGGAINTQMTEQFVSTEPTFKFDKPIISDIDTPTEIFDDYDIMREKVIMQIENLIKNKEHAISIFGILEDGILDKVVMEGLYDDSILEQLIVIAEKNLNIKKQVYMNGQNLLDELIIELSKINNLALMDIKNYARYGRITSTNIQIIEGIAEHKFSVEEINIIKNLVKKYYPDCKLF